jgi:hypothetical protein
LEFLDGSMRAIFRSTLDEVSAIRIYAEGDQGRRRSRP